MTRFLSHVKVLAALLIGGIPILVFFLAHAADPDYEYLVGRGISDVTGPPVGVQLWGFVREDQISEGIHFRLFSRAFIVAERQGDTRIAFASIDIGSVTHAMHAEVVDKLRERYGDLYTQDNVILSATHTHGGPGGYWMYGAESPIGGAFLPEHFNAIVAGIVDSIAQAHEDLQPGSIYVNEGTVDGAGANRSLTAYDNNPEKERARYGADTDKGMTLLKFADASGAIGSVNWFASHPTAMTFYSRLVSGDHKGHASARFEATQDDGFVAAFAQSNAGDVTPNLNLDNTGPGANNFETTRITAERQFEVAVALFENATDALSGGIDYRHAFVNLANLEVDAAFTGDGPQTTCPSAYGYAFAAGSTEDGGGNALFREGMKVRNAMIDGTVKRMFQLPDPSDECRECHAEKVVLFTAGEQEPPGQAQIVPLTLARVGQLTLVVVPSEFTTMAGRRLRETVANALGASSEHVVLVGYANDYAGYVTTREEYATQQYEGGHTLFGPWTLAAYEQEFTELARALVEDRPVEAGPTPHDMRGQAHETLLSAPTDSLPAKTAFGGLATKAKKSYKAGDTVEVGFWSGDPRNDFQTGNSYLAVQRLDAGAWTTVATDNDWSTQCQWVQSEENPSESQFVVSWRIPDGTVPGDYRVTHQGSYLDATGKTQELTGQSRTFKVK